MSMGFVKNKIQFNFKELVYFFASFENNIDDEIINYLLKLFNILI